MAAERVPPTAAEILAQCAAIGERLLARGECVTTAESCTGGLVAKLLTDVAGASSWFATGLVTYSNEAKQRWLSVPAQVFETYGAVSGECVRAMADGALEATGANWAVSVSGIAGPGGGSEDKPVGTVWIGWGGRHCATAASRFHFAGDRDAVRWQSAVAALRGLQALLEASAGG